MRFIGQLINADDAARDDVFAGYGVELSYLTREGEEGHRVLREQRESFAVDDPKGRFDYGLPDLFQIATDQPLSMTVRDALGVEVFAERFPWEKILPQIRLEKPLRIPVSPSRPQAPAEPLVLKGRLRFADDHARTTGFAGYRVSASYAALDPTSGARLPQSESTTLGDAPPFRFALPGPDALGDAPVALEARYPDGSIAATRTLAADELDDEVVLDVRPVQPPVLTASGRAEAAEADRIKGKVVDALGQVQISQRQVILWSKGEGGQAHPVLVASTDNRGNFTGERPAGRHAAVVATVAGTLNRSLDKAIPVELDEVEPGEDGDGRRGRLPRFVYLVVEAGEAADHEDDDCGCSASGAPRLPDPEDLVYRSDSYSQDIGLNCVNFTVPNRTLEEFTYTMVVRTSEPEIKGTTLSDIEKRDIRIRPLREAAATESPKSTAAQKLALNKAFLPFSDVRTRTMQAYGTSDLVRERMSIAPYLQDLFKTVPGRAELTAGNAIDWDGTPTFYQATTIAHGHILYYKQIWKADGYSLGDLIYSLPLAPGQKKQVVVFDWDRTEYGRRDEASRADEALDSYLAHNRDILDITSGSFSEQLRGGSNSRTSGSAGGFGIAAGGLFGPIFAGVAGGFSASSGSSSSSAWQDSSRSLSAQGLNQLRDVVQQGASAVRNQRATVVQTARQNERFRVETEVVANYNHCHAITVQYFEVLRHYAIEQKLTHVQECLFIPLLMSPFDEPKVMRWMDVLRPSLRDPNLRQVFRLSTGGISVRDKPLAAGFEAIERRQNAGLGSELPATTYAAEKVLDLSGELTITLSLNRPRDKDDEAADRPIVPEAWNVFGLFTGWTADYIFNNYFAKRAQQERDRVFEEEIAPRIAEGFVDTLQVYAVDGNGGLHRLPLDTTLVSRYRRDAPLHVSIRPTQGEMPVRRDQITRVVIATSYDLTKSANSRILVRALTLRYRTAHFDGVLIRNDAINNDLKSMTLPTPGGAVVLPVDNVTVYTPLSREELRNPREEDKEASAKLLRHLNANIEFYHKAIWARMDPDRRYMLLDGFLAPNAGGRSVASVVENRVIGVAGNSLIMPVAPGYKLDPTYQNRPVRDEEGRPVLDEAGRPLFEAVDLLDHYKPLTPIPPFRVSVPTRGVFAEAVMGACNSCEKKDETRFWRWEESPLPDQPTPIQPVATAPPQRSDPGDMKASPFPTPMINIQNAPSAPEPGATLGPMMELLGKSDVFRDVAGLEQTQKNALQAMLSNQESAKHYADRATQLATLAANQRNGNSTVESIKKSMDDGTLDRGTGQKLIEDVYRAQISGKPAPEQPANTANQSKLADAAAEAVKGGRDVKVQQSHPDGTQTSVEQKASEPPLSTTTLTFMLERKDPKTGAWVPLPGDQGPGFAKFDRAFDAAGALQPDFPDQDSGAFRVVLLDPSSTPVSAAKEVTWQTVFDTAGKQPYLAAPDAVIRLQSDPNQPGRFVSGPLVIVAEKEDLPATIRDTSGTPVAFGARDYRARLGGMFGAITLEHRGSEATYPILAAGQHALLPIHVFLLKQNGATAVTQADIGACLALVQQVYEPHGVFFNAQPYAFSPAQTAKYKPTAFTVGQGVKYACSEIDVTGEFDSTKMSEADLTKLGIAFPPSPGGPLLRIFFIGNYAHNLGAGTDKWLGFAMNRSYVDSLALSAADKQKLMFSLTIAGAVPGVARQLSTVPHEIGHLVMDKQSALRKAGKPLPGNRFNHHFNPPATSGYPLKQNLMAPEATQARGISAKKRIWDVADADGYNQAEDLRSNAQALQIKP